MSFVDTAATAVSVPPIWTLPTIVAVPSATPHFDAWAQSAYAEHYHEHNIHFRRGIRSGIPAVVLGDELVDDSELLRSEWYEFCRRLDMFHLVGAQVHVQGTIAATFGAHRPRESRRFGESDRRDLKHLLPHLQRALQIRFRLGLTELERTFSVQSLGGSAAAVLLVTATRHIVFCNEAAEAVMRTERNITVRDGVLRLANERDDAELARLVANAATSVRAGSAAGGVIEPHGASGASIIVSPLPSSVVDVSFATALVSLQSASPRPSRLDQLATRARLTASEKAVVAAIVRGETLATYAEAQRISVGTARIQLKRAFEKTGCHRQADLVRAVLGAPIE